MTHEEKPPTERIAFVSGASSGFGWAICVALVKEDYKVIAAARRLDKLKLLQEQLGPMLHPVSVDVSDKLAVARVLTTLAPELKDIDLLVNNAGLALGLEPAHKSALEDWQKMIDTNIIGLLNLTHAILPGMVERQRGHIINMGSVAGTYPYPGGNVYGATKAFVEQFSLNLRADLAGTQVRVTNIEPGMCSGTEFSNVRFKGDQTLADAVYQGVQPITPQDIAQTVCWVASRPAHVNVNRIEMMPTAQSFSPLHVTRRTT
jgi:3-hydroxy acid dehydrogenase / malonic semialdehyde reductase